MDDYTPYTDIITTLAKNIAEIKKLPCLKKMPIKYEQLSDLCTDLKRSIARRPRYEGKEYFCENIFRYTSWTCPNCFAEHSISEQYSYCPHCGQELDWSDDYGE